MENVGDGLLSYTSALSSGVGSLVDVAIQNDRKAKMANLQTTRELMALPSTRLAEYVLFQTPTDPGAEPEFRIIRFNILVPTFVMENNRPLVIDKFAIKSHFEAMIKKTWNVTSETEAHAGGKMGLIPEFNFDITEKLTVDAGGEESQSSTFDLDMQMAQGEPSLGYQEIVKSFTRCINKVMDYVVGEIQNAAVISEEDAKKLNEEADVPIDEVTNEPAEGDGGEEEE